jgi:N-acetylglutamate synthase-like GNAT family acetyltransferase
LADITLRPAAAGDASAIKNLIHRVGINPMDLDWHRFVLAVDGSGKMLGCGQVKPHGTDVLELASIAVEPERQRQGIARLIIEHLLAQAPRPLYLTCRSNLGPFYQRWGFQAIKADREMPAYFRRLMRLVAAMPSFLTGGETLLVMKLS